MLPSLSARDAQAQLEQTRQSYDADLAALRQAETSYRDMLTGLDKVYDTDIYGRNYDPVIWDEWQQIRFDQYRKDTERINDLARTQRGADVNQRLADAPWPIIYGQVRTGGIITFATIPTGSTEYLWLGFTLAGHEINRILTVYVNGEAVLWENDIRDAGGNPNSWGQTGTKWEDKIFISVRTLGGHSTVNTDLQSDSDTYFAGLWTDRHIQAGRAFVPIKFKFDNELFADGLPQVEFVLEGNNQIYDPRTSSTGYSANAALCIAHHLTNSSYGLGDTWADVIDETDLGEQADICDEEITLADGTTEARYEINGILTTETTPRDHLAQMVTCIGGSVNWVSGQWLIRCASWPDTAGDLTLTEDDTLSALSISLMPGAESRYNRVRGTFIDARNDAYTLTEFPPIVNSLYLSQDGNYASWLDVPLPLCTSVCQAQRLGKIELERVRQGIEVRGEFTLRAYQLQVGDVVGLTNSLCGWTAKLFEVTASQLVLGGQSDRPQYRVALTLQETAEAVFDWNEGEETQRDLAPNTNLPDPKVAYPPTAVSVASGTTHLIESGDGTILSRMYVSWTAPNDPFVTAAGYIDAQYKLSSASAWLDAGSVAGGLTATYTPPVRDGSLYDVRVRSRNVIGGISEWVVVNAHVVIGQAENPSDVTGMYASIDRDAIRLQWNAITDIDRAFYRVKVGSSSWDESSYVTGGAELRATSINIKVPAAGTYTYRVKAVDRTAHESTNDATITIQVVAPKQPTVTATISGEDVLLTWDDATTQFSIREYIISYGATAGETEIARVTAQVYRHHVDWAGPRRFWVQAVDAAGNTGSAGFALVDIVVPGPVRNLTKTLTDNNVLLNWMAPTVGTMPIKTYSVSKGDTFAAATDESFGNATSAIRIETVADTYTYWVYAIDSAGNSGDTSSITAVVRQPPDFELKTSGTLHPHYCKRENVLCGQSAARLAAHFVSADSTYLSHADAAALSIGNDQDFTLVVRFRATLDDAAQVIVSKLEGADANSEYQISITAGNELRFSVVGAVTQTDLDSAAALTSGTWYTAICWFDFSESKIYAQYGSVAAYEAAHAANINNGSAALNLGRQSSGADYLDGDIAFCALWKRTLTSTERQRLIDIASGLEYAYLDEGLQEELVACWDLNEDSDGSGAIAREDAYGIYDLTDNNTTASIDTWSDTTRCRDFADDVYFAPIVTGETWAEHFERTATTSFQDLIDAGYTYYLQPSAIEPAYIEYILDLGLTLGSTTITASKLSTAVIGAAIESIYIATSSDGETFGDYTQADSVFGSDVRAVKVKHVIISTDGLAFSRIMNGRYRLDVKHANYDLITTCNASDHFGTVTPFEKTFIDIDRISVVSHSTQRAALFRNRGAEYLTCQHHADFEAHSRDFTCACWVKLTATQNAYFLLSEYDTDANRGWELIINASGGKYYVQIAVSHDGAHITTLTDDQLGEVPVHEWLFIAWQHDYTNSKLRLKINEFAFTEVAYAADIYASDTDLRVGAYAQSPDTSRYLDGLMRNAGIWHEALDQEQLDNLYWMGLCQYAELSETRVVADFTAANSESLWLSDRSALTLADEMTFAGWVYLKDINADYYIASHMGASGTFSWAVLYDQSESGFRFRLSSDGTTWTDIDCDSGGAIKAERWYFVCARLGELEMEGAMADIAMLTVDRNFAWDAFAGSLYDSSVNVVLGSNAAGANYLNGYLCCCGLWSRVLTSEEVKELYNNKHPRDYSSLTNGLITDLCAYWNLDEASGNRADGNGHLELVDGNTVASTSSDIMPYAANVKAYWELDEAAGTRADSTTAHDLIDFNTVGSLILDVQGTYNFEDEPYPTKFFPYLVQDGIRISAEARCLIRGYVDDSGIGVVVPNVATDLLDVTEDLITDALGESLGVLDDE